MPVRLETLLTSPKAFGLTTATPLQRAICRISDGEPLGNLWDVPEVRRALGGARPPEKPPEVLVILAAIRSAKTLIAAAKTVQASQNISLTIGKLNGVDVPIGKGDEIRMPLLSIDKDRAGQAFSHVRNNVIAAPKLRPLLIGEPKAESLWLRHPSGRPIEVAVSAMSKAGSTLVARWLAGAVFDEAPRMVGSDDGEKSLDEAMAASAGRILKGGQTLLIGSPWAPFGPVYELVQKHFGNPEAHVVVVRAPGPDMNPVYWTEERCEKLRTLNPQAYRTDVLGEFTDPEEAMFSSGEVELCTRAGPERIPLEKGHHYVATMDPATRGNAWTLVILENQGPSILGGFQTRYRVVHARQWIGSRASPLSPAAILGQVAEDVHSYGLDQVWTDQYAIDALNDLATPKQLGLLAHDWTASNRLKGAENVNLLLREKALELPANPQLRTDLLQCRKRVTQNGVTLVLPKTGDGRHCDYIPSLSLACTYLPEPPDSREPEVDEDLQRALASVEGGQDWDSVLRRMQGMG